MCLSIKDGVYVSRNSATLLKSKSESKLSKLTIVLPNASRFNSKNVYDKHVIQKLLVDLNLEN